MQKRVSYLDRVIHKVLLLIKAGIVLFLSAGCCATSIDIPCNISLHIVFVSVRVCSPQSLFDMWKPNASTCQV